MNPMQNHFTKILCFFLGLTLLAIPLSSFSQSKSVSISGQIKDPAGHALPYVNVMVKTATDSSFVAGTISNEEGRFQISDIKEGKYILETSFIGYKTQHTPFLVGHLSDYLDLGNIALTENTQELNEVVVKGQQDAVSEVMDKKTFAITENLSQLGGSVLQAMKNLPGITVSQDGKVQLRGNDKVTVLVDGKQTALTGFGSQAGLDNIPVSAIEKIEVINNPTAKNDANGSAGIINIIFKKNQQEGLNGKVGITGGLGAIWKKKENLPTIRDQYQYNPKINPTISLNYRKKNTNVFLQGDVLWQKALNKNEYIQQLYNNGDVIQEQFLENRTQLAFTVKTGFDWNINEHNTFSISALYNREGHIDRGDLPYFNGDLTIRRRLWSYYEDEVNTAINSSAVYTHKFKQAGHTLAFNLNYSFHREDEKFYFTNSYSDVTKNGNDTTKLIADENVGDLNIDYVKPLRHGRMEFGTKLRYRFIPTTMKFSPGVNSVLDLGSQGWANYNEMIGAVYGNYVYESSHVELEAGLRLENVHVYYDVIPTHNTYKSNGYDYIQPFPNVRMAYIINSNNKISFFYNRRVDRPDEYDLRIFPKYDDPVILKNGNPNIKPQFTQTFELGYKSNWKTGYLYTALFTRLTDNILTRIQTQVSNPPSNLGTPTINSISQNAGTGSNSGVELIWNQQVNKLFSFNLNFNVYQNIINAFNIENAYPLNVPFFVDREEIVSGNIKFNGYLRPAKNFEIQLTSIYLAPDVVPQGKIDERYTLDIGLKKSIQNRKGEIFMNISDIFNTMRVRKTVTSNNLSIISNDLYETQVFRLGYSYKF